MNRELAMKIADAVLYEGYMLYPYRPSALKNRQRWSFGILYPPTYGEVAAGTERSEMHSECLVKVAAGARLEIQLRFLQLVTREISQVTEHGLQPARSLVVDGRSIESSDEGIERSLTCEIELLDGFPQGFPFSFQGSRETETLRDVSEQVVGEVARVQHEVSGTVSISTEVVRKNLLKVFVDISNSSSLVGAPQDRNSALLTSLLSAHTILTATEGEFVSLLDPPDELREAVSGCKNVGNFPVLVGAEGECDMMLCSPIVLYDYPQIAPESAGDFFDGTEMDEMLTLRVMTLTDEEKQQVLGANHHVRELLQRTEASAREQLMRTHGTIRSLRPVDER